MDIADIKKRKATLFSRISYNKKKGNDTKDLEKELKELNKQLDKLNAKDAKSKKSNKVEKIGKKEVKKEAKKGVKKGVKKQAKKKAKKEVAEIKSHLNPKWDEVIEGCKIAYKTKKYDDDSNLNYLEELKSIGCDVEYEYADQDENTYTKVFVSKSNDFYGVFSSTREAYNDLKKWKWI